MEEDPNANSADGEDKLKNDHSFPAMNDSWFGKPVEEVDPMIFDDTFCVISKKMGKNFIHRYSCTKSLFLLGPMNPLRRLAICIVTNRYFDILIMLTIACNCVTLAMITNEFEIGTDYRIPSPFDAHVDLIEYVFLAIFSCEVVLKVIAKGFLLNRFSYLRNRWNILDFVVVVTGFITIYSEQQVKALGEKDEENGEIQFLRTFRVLRVVKTISIFPGLKMMINALLSSVTQLLEVMVLTIISLCIFALFGQEMFQGRLRNKCVRNKGGSADPDHLINTDINDEPEELKDKLWTDWVLNYKNWKGRSFPKLAPMFCGNRSNSRGCGAGYTCIGNVGKNPDNGWTSFDNFWSAMLSSFQLLTLDYWERLYDIVISTCGVWSLFFFLLVIFLGSYYLINLMLAVVAMSYENEFSTIGDDPLTPGKKLEQCRRNSNFSFDQLSKLNVCKMTHYRKRTKSERELQAKRMKLRGSESENGDVPLRIDDAIFSLLGIKMTLASEKREGSLIADSDSDIHGAEKERVLLEPPPDGDFHEDHEDEKNSRMNIEGGGSQVDIDKMDFTSRVASRLSHLAPPVARYKKRLAVYCTKYLKPVVNHTFFETFITICIVANTIVLAMEHHGQTKEMEELLKMFNNVFMAVFSAECILKLMALQSEYFQSGWNIFDMLIVLVSYFDLVIAEVGLANKRSGGLSVIRSMRLLRVFKLAQSWVTMKVLMNIIFSSFGALGNLTCVLLIILYIFAVMGMQVIGGKYTYAAFDALNTPSAFPTWHFRHFWYAFMMVFRVLCGEWIEPLWECFKAQKYHYSLSTESQEQNNSVDYAKISTKGEYVSYMKCFLIFFPILIVGNFIVLNLFLALLLNSFDTEELNAQRERELQASGRAENLKNIVGLLMKKEDQEEASGGGATEHVHEPAPDNNAGARGSKPSIKGDDKNPTGKGSKEPLKDPAMPSSVVTLTVTPKQRFINLVNNIILRIRIADAARAIARMENRQKRLAKLSMPNKLYIDAPPGRGGGHHHDITPDSSEGSEELTVAGECIPTRIWRSRFCPCKRKPVARANRRKIYKGAQRWDDIRALCVAIVGNSAFEWTILTLIFASSITLCFEDIHLDKKPKLKQTLCYLNYAFTGIFVVEMILKWFAMGIWGYFTGAWTLLDAFIVAVSLVSVYFDVTLDACSASATTQRSGAAANLGALKALRTLRALRPLRAISRWEGMKIVVNALMYAIPSIFNVLLVCLLFWLIFSIMGVQFFKGQFYVCLDSDGERVDWRLAPTREVCCTKTLTHDYSWTNTGSNFDNVFEGYLSLFQIATFEGWMELMQYSVDIAGVDVQPIPDNQIGYYGFYVVFIIFGSFFTLQLFIGVIIDNFNMLKKKYEGNMLEILLTPTQRKYYIAMKNLGKWKPKKIIRPPKTKFFKLFYDLALSRTLEVAIYTMLFLNMVVEAFENAKQGQLTIHIMNGANAFFTTIYCLEALVKIIGLGTFYFTIPWNVYDFILVGASLMDAFCEGDLTVSFPIPPTMLRIVRFFRIGRVLRRVKAAEGIRKLLFALVVSLPALFNIGALLALITFIYAILGMTLFGKAAREDAVDDLFNFDTFLNSNLMLLRLMTAAGWNEILESLAAPEPVCGNLRRIHCGRPDEPECINRGLVVAYIVSYLILTYLIVINLYIAIILENYVEASNEADVGMTEDDLEMFYVRWSRYDPYATQFIDFGQLSVFLDNLDHPFKIPKPNILAIVSFNLPISRGNKLHCLDILYTLITHVLDPVEDSPEFKKLQMQIEHKFQKQFPTRKLLDVVSSTRRWKIEHNAAIVIQRAWRAYWKRKHAPSPEQKSADIQGKTVNPAGPKVEPSRSHGGLGHMMNRLKNV